jgi:hypothetical protein
MSLNTTLGKIEYNDDEEYRICIARIFCKVPLEPTVSSATDLEPTVLSELEQGSLDPTDLDDDFSFEPIFDDIYARTKDDPFFQRIYTVAAGFMLSEDPCLGVCVLFAYDYAKAFYAVLCAYLNNDSNETLEATKATLEKLLEQR